MPGYIKYLQQQFGDLTLVGPHFDKILPSGRKIRMDKVKCICGREYFVQRQHLTGGTTKNCGCRRADRISAIAKKNAKHGMRHTLFYMKYESMKGRCYRKHNDSYKDYGGRGITCEWKTFLDFKNDMYESYLKFCKENPNQTASIERKDVNGNYCKENCMWIPMRQQGKNTRRSRIIEYKGEKKILSDWEKEYRSKLGGGKSILRDRLKKGWSMEIAMTEPVLTHDKVMLRMRKGYGVYRFPRRRKGTKMIILS